MQTTTLVKIPLTQELIRKSRLLSLAGDQSRIRILCFMFKHQKACVTDIANGLGMSLASVSHHLRLLRDNGLLSSERLGNNICYILVVNEFTKKLEKIIC